MIEELVGRVFALRNAAHLEHWATNSFSKHMALGKFYDKIIDKTDTLVEAYQGWHGLIGEVTIPKVSRESAIKQIEKDAAWIAENRSKISQGNAMIENLIDDLSETYASTHYKLNQLK